MADDNLADFDTESFSHDGKTRPVFRKGDGPAVIVMAEFPGISPDVFDFARRVAARGCTAVVPHLYGVPGRDPDPDAHGPVAAVANVLSQMGQVCVSREFVVLATGRTSPVVRWLRALAEHEHRRCGGPGVGAVGMCFTGGFALAMAVDERIVAPVLSQPGLPLAITSRRRGAIDVAPSDMERIRSRCAQGLSVLGLRFAGDRRSPAERFAFLREQLGDAFIAVELDDATANPDAVLSPHSVLTEHLIDEPGQPTYQALQRVLDFLGTKLEVRQPDAW
ncbi:MULTISPECIES: dienelactone hydrolase family protein [Mycolicibacterium]|uniref:dienelactone hydrolase family protein n=1 Tax=Mycolicibacterium TaxID=1866885 RepID=UPI000FA628EA|nr:MULTISPECIES: dienelactone hydrolase family protein [Mycolicibacterium]RUP31438.1 MAG: dienelactone hydrolase [Mycolicibacterium sp.]UCZ60529.1 dienelactone hydrolase family protein [Mycolicibacterium phocaicum]